MSHPANVTQFNKQKCIICGKPAYSDSASYCVPNGKCSSQAARDRRKAKKKATEEANMSTYNDISSQNGAELGDLLAATQQTNELLLQLIKGGGLSSRPATQQAAPAMAVELDGLLETTNTKTNGNASAVFISKMSGMTGVSLPKAPKKKGGIIAGSEEELPEPDFPDLEL